MYVRYCFFIMHGIRCWIPCASGYEPPHNGQISVSHAYLLKKPSVLNSNQRSRLTMPCHMPPCAWKHVVSKTHQCRCLFPSQRSQKLESPFPKVFTVDWEIPCQVCDWVSVSVCVCVWAWCAQTQQRAHFTHTSHAKGCQMAPYRWHKGFHRPRSQNPQR